MVHYGDITKINGAKVPVVDIVCGGSPCQDLSVAGKRAGLVGERSGLFMEQIRVIKEMREHDREQIRVRGTNEAPRPRFMVWENVPGVFSSNGGEDFRAVLEETARIADETIFIPRPPKKWTHSGVIMGDGWSIAWRVHDAQFWGVPQRRKRIALVADFTGGGAAEILAEFEGVPGDSETSREKGEDTPRTAEGGTGETVYCIQGNCIDRADTAGCNGRGWTEDVSYTLNTIDRPAVAYSFDSMASNSMKSKNPFSGCRQVETAKTLDCSDCNPSKNQGGIAIVQDNRSAICALTTEMTPKIDKDGIAFSLRSRDYKDAQCICIEMTSTKNTIIEDGVCPTLTARMGTGGNQVNAVCIGNGQPNQISMLEKANTLDTMHDQQAIMVTYGLDRAAYNQGINAKYDFSVDEEKIGTQTTMGPGAVCACDIVRRLTPLEYERLQGFPDGWTDIGDWTDSKGKKHKGDADTPRYKALGNSIALPFWQWMAHRMVKHLGKNPTMASLFSGIGGFELVFSRAGCKPLWASEIEEFPIAVTKLRFAEVE